MDDPVGAIGVHAGSSACGLIAVGLFADRELVGIDIMDVYSEEEASDY